MEVQQPTQPIQSQQPVQPSGPQEPPIQQPKKRSNGLIFLFGLIGAFLIILLIGFGFVLNSVNNVSENKLVLSVAKTFNLSAAKINGAKVSYVDYIEDLNALKNFYSTQQEGVGTASEEQMSDQVLVRLLANKLLDTVAKTLDVEVADEVLAAEEEKLLAQFPSKEDAEENIKNLYGWSLDQFRNKIVYPVVLEQKIQEAFVSSDGNLGSEFLQEEVRARHILFQAVEDEELDSVKKRAEEVLERINGGEDFAALAIEFGTDGTKDVGGDLGFFGIGFMVPEFEQATFGMQPGDPAQIIQTQFGYHIVQTTEKRTSKDFQAFMDDTLKNAKVEILISAHNPFEDVSEDSDDQLVDEGEDAGDEEE